MNALNRQVDVIEELVVVLDRHAGREEHHHLLLAVLLQEGEQQQQPLFRRANDVTLKMFKVKQFLLFSSRNDWRKVLDQIPPRVPGHPLNTTENYSEP